jgi:hypothetical protein
MARFKSKLDNVRVAAPCNVDWDTMYGNERVRFCDQCKLNVYNLSELTRAEAERLVGNAEGRLCIRYYRRRDGSILTQNCPVGLRALKRRMSRIASAIGSTVLSFFAGLGVYGLFSRTEIPNLGGYEVMGDMVIETPKVDLPPSMPVASMGVLAVKEPTVRIRKHQR